MPFEHIATIDDVHRFLDGKAQGHLCQDLAHCDSWRIEPELINALASLKKRLPATQANVDEVRRLIRAVSWMSHDRPQGQALLDLIDQATAISADTKTLLTQAINDNLSDQAALPAIDAIETLVDGAWADVRRQMAEQGVSWPELSAKTKLHRERERLEQLRPLRDQFYFQYLYPTWFAAGREATAPPGTG